MTTQDQKLSPVEEARRMLLAMVEGPLEDAVRDAIAFLDGGEERAVVIARLNEGLQEYDRHGAKAAIQKPSADDFEADAERLEGHVRWGEAHGMGEGLFMIAEVAKNLREAARRLRTLEAEIEEWKRHFQLYDSAMTRAREMWEADHPDEADPLVWPDAAKSLQSVIARLRTDTSDVAQWVIKAIEEHMSKPKEDWDLYTLVHYLYTELYPSQQLLTKEDPPTEES